MYVLQQEVGGREGDQMDDQVRDINVMTNGWEELEQPWLVQVVVR